MNVRRTDIAIFVYNVAVVASGAAVVTSMGIESPALGVAAAVPLAVGWTAYVRLSLIDRLLDLDAADGESDGDDADAGDDGAGDGGARPPWES